MSKAPRKKLTRVCIAISPERLAELALVGNGQASRGLEILMESRLHDQAKFNQASMVMQETTKAMTEWWSTIRPMFDQVRSEVRQLQDARKAYEEVQADVIARIEDRLSGGEPFADEE